jgi:hypothetical protein
MERGREGEREREGEGDGEREREREREREKRGKRIEGEVRETRKANTAAYSRGQERHILLPLHLAGSLDEHVKVEVCKLDESKPRYLVPLDRVQEVKGLRLQSY